MGGGIKGAYGVGCADQAVAGLPLDTAAHPLGICQCEVQGEDQAIAGVGSNGAN